MTLAEFNPGLTLIAGGLLLPLLRGKLRALFLLLLPVAGLVHLSFLVPGMHGVVDFLGYELVTLRVDRWSMVFGWVFMIASCVSAIYALHLRTPLQLTAGMTYAGSAIGAVFAGDLMTLFVFWELTAITSVLLVWAGRGPNAYAAGMRYLIVQIISGTLLFFGAAIQFNTTGSLEFGAIGLAGVGGWLIFIAFGIKAAFPLLHAWLPDAYPEASEVGTVFLSAFTTKLAVYALARGFAGTELLIPIGAAMVVFPIFFALLENDLRRVLAYSLNNQLGFMVVGIGIGTEMSLNGAAAHAFTHVLYKSLLFMSMGAVLYRAGTVKASELGGLWRSMPLTAVFCIVGVASIAGMPFFSGFVSKSMIVSAAAQGGYMLAWSALMFAAACMFLPDLKIPFFAFFGRDSGKRCQEAPLNMLVAMAIAAAFCVGIGLMPGRLYALLPYPVAYAPYSVSHVLAQLQLLLFAGLVFAVVVRWRLLPLAVPGINLDVDWLLRRPGALVVKVVARILEIGGDCLSALLSFKLSSLSGMIERHRLPDGLLLRSWPTGSMSLWVMLMLFAYLLLYYLGG